jgi:DDE family transposase
VNDAERLSQDPTFRLIGSEKIWERGAALPSRLHWFETEVLSQDENLDGLSRINRELLAKAEAMDSAQRVVLDMDSTEIPVYGEQEHSAYNISAARSWTGRMPVPDPAVPLLFLQRACVPCREFSIGMPESRKIGP